MRISKGKSKLLASIAIALLLCAQYLSTVIGLYTSGSGDGFFTPVIIISGIIVVVSFAMNPTTKINISFFVLVLTIVLAYILTMGIVPEHTNLSSNDFFGMCLLPLLAAGLLLPDYEKALSFSMILLLLGLPVFESLFTKANAGLSYDAVSMGTSYAIVPPIGAGILHFFFYRKKSNIVEKMGYVVTLIYLGSFVVMSYRGALISIIVLFILGLAFSIEENKHSKRYRRTIIICGLAAIGLMLNSNRLLGYIAEIFNSYNIRIAFLQKSLYLTGTGDLTHGRLQIWETALHGFWESPVWGHGMSTFLCNTGIVFPHNFILQFLYDGGIILCGIFLWLLVKGLVSSFTIMRKQNMSKFTFFLLPLSIALTRTAVSAEVWRVMLFWMMMGLMCNKRLSVEETENEAK